MPDRFSVDEDAVDAAARRLRAAGADLLDAHRALAGILDTRAGCWGGDEVGQAFATNYLEFADGTRTNTAALADNQGAVADYTEDVVDELVAVDAGNAQQIAEVDGLYADDIESWTEDA